MEKLYITHYYYPGTDPWQNIMHLPEQEAFRVAGELAAAHPETTSFGRFADFVNYYPRRKAADEYVRNAFIRMGGKPKLSNPFAFVLGDCEYLRNWFDSSDKIVLDLTDIPDEQVSFTLGDSCAIITQGHEPKVLTKKMLSEGIEECGSLEAFCKKSLGKYAYVEVQLWERPENKRISTGGRNAMQFKEGLGWKACHDEERNIYTAQRSRRGFYQLCEIDAETYNKLSDDGNADKLIGSGRVLFESDDDYYTQRYYRIVDENYDELAPWASAKWIAGKSDVLDRRYEVVNRFPGVGFAYGSEVYDSAQYFGVADEESGASVDEETIFPACSISKFVTAVCVMKLQELNLVDIDERVNKYLKQWKLLSAEGAESDATIRNVLSHTAGIIDGEDGFYGLRIGALEVSLLDILNGCTKYNNRPVRTEHKPGTAFEYSDAGYCVLQQMIENVTGKEFANLVNELVFEALGLTHTFFASPAEREKHKANMATGYDDAGDPIPGKYPVTPDLAASGLWSTPKELWKLSREFFRALNGKSSFLQADSAREIIKPAGDFSWTGLGVFLEGEKTLVSRGWGENGQCMLKLHLESGEASVVMTNNNPGKDQAESGVEWLTDSYVWFM